MPIVYLHGEHMFLFLFTVLGCSFTPLEITHIKINIQHRHLWMKNSKSYCQSSWKDIRYKCEEKRIENIKINF